MTAGRADFGVMRALLATLSLVFAFVPGAARGALLELVTDQADGPIYVTHAGDDRLFIVERAGRIRIFQNGALLATPFLDISARVSGDGEGGMIGLAFDPDYATNGAFYVRYTVDHPVDGFSARLARFHVSGGDPNLAVDDEAELLFQPWPATNHVGGMIEFGPDGMLYVGYGDGGSRDDPGCRAQNGDVFFGKLLRLDVDPTGATPPFYAIPPDNPFVGDDGVADEIMDTGLRNPWRFSFDRETGDLWIGDVGQDAIEEIDVRPAWIMDPGTVNWGWKRMEGDSCANPGPDSCPGTVPPCDSPAYTGPIHQYPHTNDNRSITGGYVYRGVQAPGFHGVYIFGDFGSGRLFALRQIGPGQYQRTTLDDAGPLWVSFGEGADGELYGADLFGGRVFRIDLTAAISSADRACILGLNRQFAKLARARAAQLAKCRAQHAAGKLAGGVEECAAAVDPNVERRVAKLQLFAAGKCQVVPPFGPSDPDAVGDAATAAELDLLHDLLGADLDAALVPKSTDAVAAACQARVARTLSRCHARRVKEFDRCKQAGLEDATVKDSTTLAACLEADRKGTVAAACDAATGALAAKVLPKACVAKAVDLAMAFPGCAAADAAGLAACAERAGRCRACAALSAADALGAVCDTFDDGTSNTSCP